MLRTGQITEVKKRAMYFTLKSSQRLLPIHRASILSPHDYHLPGRLFINVFLRPYRPTAIFLKGKTRITFKNHAESKIKLGT